MIIFAIVFKFMDGLFFRDKSQNGFNMAQSNKKCESVEQKAYEAIGLAYNEFKEKGYITSYPILVGIVDDTVICHAQKIGTPIKNNAIYFKNDDLEHIWRDSKVSSGIAVSKEDVQNFPFTKSYMSIYYDSETKRYTYTDMQNKFVLETNVKIKLDNGKKEVVTLVTASKMRGVDEFEMRKYTKIKQRTVGGVEPLNTRNAPATVPRIMALAALYFTLQIYYFFWKLQPFFQKYFGFLLKNAYLCTDKS